MMFASSAVRAASRTVASTSRRQFGALTTKTVASQSKSNYARAMAPIAAATGLALTAALFQQREESTFNYSGTDPVVKAAVKEVEDKFGTYWPRNILILFGPPGAGKGTHGPNIENMMGIPQLSTGDMLRDAVSRGTEVGKKAEAVMKAGGLVSDDIVVGIIRDRIKADDCKFGFILDGFPRTLKQAEALDAMLAEEGARVTKVIELQVPDSVLEERICGRWIHKASGRSYHVKYAPPKSMKKDWRGTIQEGTMKDDETGEPLMQRKDDTSEALIKRLKGYHGETVPILDHYRPDGVVRTVNANQKMDGVWKEILEALQRQNK